MGLMNYKEARKEIQKEATKILDNVRKDRMLGRKICRAITVKARLFRGIIKSYYSFDISDSKLTEIYSKIRSIALEEFYKFMEPSWFVKDTVVCDVYIPNLTIRRGSTEFWNIVIAYDVVVNSDNFYIRNYDEWYSRLENNEDIKRIILELKQKPRMRSLHVNNNCIYAGKSYFFSEMGYNNMNFDQMKALAYLIFDQLGFEGGYYDMDDGCYILNNYNVVEDNGRKSW